MKLELYQIDAFTKTVFSGNPACVVPLKKWLSDEILLKIAQENAVAETAFFVRGEDDFHLRWFTPDIEMDLCGHATLAAAHCIHAHLKHPDKPIVFNTQSGQLKVEVKEELYTLDLPSRMPNAAELPIVIKEALSAQPKEVYKARDYLLIYEDEEQVKNIQVDRQIFDQINLGQGGVIVSAKGSHCDFVSRFFTPQATILEDPVTGSAHCTLTPFWAQHLQKEKLFAKQISERGGNIVCKQKDNRVLISGEAKTYAVGNCFIS